MSAASRPSLLQTLRSRLCLAGLLACVLLPAAHADVWGWVDENGTAHFAPTRVDTRYSLYFHAGEDFDTRDIAAKPASAYPPPPSAARMRTFFDVSADYKAVRPYLRDAARVLELDYELLQAVILTESGFNAAAVSPKGAVGLMQVMPTTAQRWGVSGDARNPVARKLADPSTNIRTGSRYLRYLLDLFPGKMELAVAAYNAGEGAVQRAGNRIPDFPETQNYVKTVMQTYRMLKPGGPRGGAGGPPQRIRMEIPADPVDAPVAARARLPAAGPGQTVAEQQSEYASGDGGGGSSQ